MLALLPTARNSNLLPVKAIGELLPSIIKESKKVIFNGNGYAEEWHAEAERRGLPNLKNTVEVLPVITRKDTLDLFAKYKVYTPKELESRFNILSEAYVKTLNIEASTALMMARGQILPAAVRYQTELAQNAAALKAAGINGNSETLTALTSAINDLTKGIGALEKAQSHHAEGSPYDHAKHMRNDVFPALNNLRTAADKLETLVADDLWPLPTYREMLFIK